MADVVTYLFFPPSTSIQSSSQSSQADFSVWVWMTLGLVGYKLCTSAIELYEFCDAWHRISQTHRVDVTVVHLSKERVGQRKIRINQALNTQPFRSSMETQTTTSQDTSVLTNPNPKQSAMERSVPLDTTGTKQRVCPHVISHDIRRFNCCPICLGEFEEGEMVSCSSSTHPMACNHLFHEVCLHAWLSKHSSCPLCRFEMLSSTTASTTTTTSLPPGALVSQLLIAESNRHFWSSTTIQLSNSVTTTLPPSSPTTVPTTATVRVSNGSIGER
jgi:Ring finger domain